MKVRNTLTTLALGLAIMLVAAMPSAAAGPPEMAMAPPFPVQPLDDTAAAPDATNIITALTAKMAEAPWRLANAIAEDAATLSTSSPEARVSAKTANTYFDNGDDNVTAARPPNLMAGFDLTTSAIDGTNLRRSDAANIAKNIGVNGARAGPRVVQNST